MPMERIENECKIQKMLSHPYIMPVCELFDFQDFRALVMPRAYGGTISDVIYERKIRNARSIGIIMYRTLKGMYYLHQNRILHGDIKPANIILNSADFEDPIPLIIDFGHACILAGKQQCNCRLMTCNYSSPEVLGLKPHSFPSDVWSLGATFYYMITGHDVLRTKQIEVMQKEAKYLKLNFEGDKWRQYPADMKDLLLGMMRTDEKQRLTIEQCLKHPFFSTLLSDEWIFKENEKVGIMECQNSDCCSCYRYK